MKNIYIGRIIELLDEDHAIISPDPGGVTAVGPDDTLIIQTEVALRDEDLRNLQKEISDRIGMKVVLLERRTNLVGVIGKERTQNNGT